jgi:hypothetical protein
MNKYICFYKRKSLLVEASTSYEASRKAAKEFKAKHPWDVSVVIAESSGKGVIHNPKDIT